MSGREPLRAADALARRFPELRWLQRLGLTHLEMPDAAVFIDLPAAEAISRIDSRGESKQVHETGEKLDKLRGAYLAVCAAAERRFDLPVLRLDGRRSREELRTEAAEFVANLRNGGRDG